MEDYIQTLLDNLEENLPASLGGTYYTALNREISAAQALADTLSEEQQRLFSLYEDRWTTRSGIYQSAYARGAFLLAREIYR